MSDSSNKLPTKSLVIDDEPLINTTLSEYLQELGHIVAAATSASRGTELFNEQKFDFVFLDINLPHTSGIKLLENFKRLDAEVIIIMISAIHDVEMVVKCIQMGAYDYLVKPIVDLNQIQIRINKALREKAIIQENRLLKQELSQAGKLSELVGESPLMRKLNDLIRAVAPYNSTVLVTGESGTGKELVARAIHKLSNRSTSKFIAVNCGSIPTTLLESTLFGHEKGAFTGATNDKIGLLEESHQGSIFLDEITETSPEFQVQLLRVLETGQIRRVGSTKNIELDLRVIAATNQNIEQCIKDGKFRADLYYRLNVFQIIVPALRERKDDIPLIVHFHVKRLSKKLARKCPDITKTTLELLMTYDWPGNIRELVNVLEYAMINSSNNIIHPNDLPRSIVTPKIPNAMNIKSVKYKQAVEQFDRNYFTELLGQSKGNISQAARVAGFSRQHLHQILKKLNIR